MIEKFDDQNGFCMGDCMDKINEVIDAVNTIQKERETEWFEIKEWIDILEAVRKSVNIHEKQIDELQMKLEPEKCKTPAENVPGPIKLYVCADGSVYGNLDVAKSHAKSIFNPLPAGATTTDRAYLERELNSTRKALDEAKKWLMKIGYLNMSEHGLGSEKMMTDWCKTVALHGLKEIETALEQKD